MVRLHSALVCPRSIDPAARRRSDAEKRDLDSRIQAEIRDAKRIQAATGCTWTEALRAAAAGEGRT